MNKYLLAPVLSFLVKPCFATPTLLKIFSYRISCGRVNPTIRNNVDILVNVDIETRRIKIYGEQEQLFNLTSKRGDRTAEDGDFISEWKAVDEKGHECIIGIILASTPSREYMGALIVQQEYCEIIYKLKTNQ